MKKAASANPKRSPNGASGEALRRAQGFARPHRRTWWLAVTAVAGRALAMIALLWASEQVLGTKEMLDSRKLQADDAVMHCLVWTLAVAGIGMVAVVFYGTAVFLWNSAAAKTIRDIRDCMFAHLSRLGAPFFDRTRTGGTASKLLNDTQYLQQIATMDLRDLLAAPVTIVGGFAYMTWLSWQLTVLVLVAVPIVVCLTSTLGRRVRRITSQLQESTATLASTLSEWVSGIRVVKIFGLEETGQERFAAENQDIYRNTMRATRVQSLLLPASEWVTVVAFCAVIWYGIYLVLHNDLTFGKLIVFALATQRVGATISRTGREWSRLQEMGGIFDRIFVFLDMKADEAGDSDLPALQCTEGHVRFEDIRFGYDAGTPVLHGVTIDLLPGQVVAVVGESGSGKSTLANLLARLYEPTGGRVLVDGQDVREYSRASLRSHFGVVLQESFLFTGTVEENIRMGRPDATDDEVRDAARAANAHDFIEALPDGYATIVGERGATLSGGQRQRVAIARALLRNPRVLILDEATSSLDSEAERVVQDALNKLMAGRTTLAIAHRLSTIHHADKIVVLDAGRIVEQGAHCELLRAGGHYARLWALQSGGSIARAEAVG